MSMTLLKIGKWILPALLCLLGSVLPVWAAPQVVVSIKPLAGLVEGVMDGVGRPQLLLPGGSSPHSYALRPSQMRALYGADLLVWVGPELESFLAKPLAGKELAAKALQFNQLPGIRLLAGREGGAWGEDEHAAAHEHQHQGTDPHLWLDPANARLLVKALSTRLIEIDPQNAESYRANALTEEQRLLDLQHRLREQLKPLQSFPYLVFHDAYQYFEQAFDLHPLGALAIHPERTPGARRIREMRRQIQERGARCVFSEPQFEPRLVTALTEGTTARHAELDPIGAKLPDGPDSYVMLLQAMADSLQACLTP